VVTGGRWWSLAPGGGHWADVCGETREGKGSEDPKRSLVEVDGTIVASGLDSSKSCHRRRQSDLANQLPEHKGTMARKAEQPEIRIRRDTMPSKKKPLTAVAEQPEIRIRRDTTPSKKKPLTAVAVVGQSSGSSWFAWLDQPTNPPTHHPPSTIHHPPSTIHHPPATSPFSSATIASTK
jgi:hypothetical protein